MKSIIINLFILLNISIWLKSLALGGSWTTCLSHSILSTITTRPLKPFLSHPLSKALYWPHGLDHHCSNFILWCDVPIEHYNFSRCTMIINKIILLSNSIWLEKYFRNTLFSHSDMFKRINLFIINKHLLQW